MLSGRRSSLLIVLLTPALALLALSCGGGGGGGGKSQEPEKGFRVLETSPRDHELAVELDRRVEFTFSEAIDPATLTSETVALADEYNDRTLIGTVTLEGDRRTARFVPAGLLTRDTRYRLTVSTTVTSEAGEPLRKEFDAWFHTVITPGEEEEEEEPEPEPRLVPVGPLNVGRSHHTSTRLPSGRVLITGGFRDATTLTDSAEIYRPLTSLFSTLTPGLRIARADHTATLLENGLVLITGGLIDGGSSVTARCELYDPSDETFTLTADMKQPRAYHTATRLADGRILVTGGVASGSFVSTRTAEIYDPEGGTFTALPDMAAYRSDHRATTLQDGRVLLTGGSSWNTTAELFDPTSDTFAATTGKMRSPRAGHSATPLVGGDVLLYGGGSRTASTYRAAYGDFVDVADSPVYDRTWHTADITAGGRVTLAGGWTQDLTLIFHASLEIFHGPPDADPRFVPSEELFVTPRVAHRSTVLSNGDILFTGGINVDPSQPELRDAALYEF